MFGLWDKKDKQTPSDPANPGTDPIVNEFAVLYKVGSLSDMARVMGQEAQERRQRGRATFLVALQAALS